MSHVSAVEERSYEIRFEPRPGFLYVHIKGEKNTLAISRAIWTQIAAECKRRDCNRVLVAQELKEMLSMLDIFQISSEVPAMGFSRIRVAFVDLLNLDSARVEFGANVAVNRGGIGQVFQTVPEAERWLKSLTQTE